jgi:hypothetical protein
MRKATSSTDRAPVSHVRANPAALRGSSKSLGHDADYVSHVTDIVGNRTNPAVTRGGNHSTPAYTHCRVHSMKAFRPGSHLNFPSCTHYPYIVGPD